MPDIISDILEHLKNEVKKDSFNLTRDDHDAIDTKIDETKKFIQEKYDKHKPQQPV